MTACAAACSSDRVRDCIGMMRDVFWGFARMCCGRASGGRGDLPRDLRSACAVGTGPPCLEKPGCFSGGVPGSIGVRGHEPPCFPHVLHVCVCSVGAASRGVWCAVHYCVSGHGVLVYIQKNQRGAMVHGACATSVWRFLIELRFRHHFASTMFDGSNRCRGWAESP